MILSVFSWNRFNEYFTNESNKRSCRINGVKKVRMKQARSTNERFGGTITNSYIRVID